MINVEAHEVKDALRSERFPARAPPYRDYYMTLWVVWSHRTPPSGQPACRLQSLMYANESVWCYEGRGATAVPRCSNTYSAYCLHQLPWWFSEKKMTTPNQDKLVSYSGYKPLQALLIKMLKSFCIIQVFKWYSIHSNPCINIWESIASLKCLKEMHFGKCVCVCDTFQHPVRSGDRC